MLKDDPFFELNLDEINFEFQCSTRLYKARIDAFMEELGCYLSILQRDVQNMLLFTHESCTYCLQAVDESLRTPLL